MPIQQKRDSEIEQRVIRQLRVDKGLGSKELCVFCSDGVVTLKGSVLSDRGKTIAQSAAFRMEGVVAVVNEIAVKPAKRVRSRVRGTRPEAMPLLAGRAAAGQ